MDALAPLSSAQPDAARQDLPLAGVRVVDLAATRASGAVRLLLSDAGAESIAFHTGPAATPWDRRTRHVTGSDSDEVVALLGTADVMLFGPTLPEVVRSALASPDRAPLGGLAETLRAIRDLRSRRPDVVTALVTAYGTQGPLARRATDSELLVGARMGLASLQSGWSPGPCSFVAPVISINAALLLAAGVLAALVGRARTGRGDQVETSLLGGALATLTESMVSGPGIDVGEQRKLVSRRASAVQPFYGAYECADGRWLHLGASYPEFIVSAARAIGLEAAAPEIIRSTGFDRGRISSLATRDALYPLIERAIAKRSLAEWLGILEAADVPVAPVQSPAEFLDDPQAAVNGLVSTRDAAGRLVEQGGPALRFGAAGINGVEPTTAPETALSRSRIGGIDVVADGPDRGRGGAPLTDVRVLEFGNLVAAPLAGRLLADLGADVVKLEPVDGGDLTRRHGVPAFHPLNAGKQGIAVNLKDPRGLAIAEALAARSDVVIANMRPGAMKRLGLGVDRLLALNPRLVVCNASAFGSRGPYAHRPGVDGLAAAIAGLQSVQGEADGRPVQLTAATTDHATGLLTAVGALVGLVRRARTGTGVSVETSLLDAAALLNADRLVRVDGKVSAGSPTASQYGPSAVQRLYATTQSWIGIDAVTDESWTALTRVLDAVAPNPGEAPVGSDPRFLTPAGRAQHDGALASAIEARLATDGPDVWLARLEAGGVATARVTEQIWSTFVSDEQLIAMDSITAVQTADGLGPIRFSQRWLRIGDGAGVRAGAPRLGEHTCTILRDLGYADETIARLIADRVVGTPGDDPNRVPDAATA